MNVVQKGRGCGPKTNKNKNVKLVVLLLTTGRRVRFPADPSNTRSCKSGPRLAELPPGTCRPRVKNIVNMQRSAALLQTGDNFSTGTTKRTSSATVARCDWREAANSFGGIGLAIGPPIQPPIARARRKSWAFGLRKSEKV